MPSDARTSVTEIDVAGYELVVRCEEPASGYLGYIALHSTRLGPAVGGTRVWRYESEEAALEDVLRLSRGMTYKNALAGLPLGGGKSVVVAPEGAWDRERIFSAHGRFVERLGGRYVTAEDVGTSPADMLTIRAETRHVAGLQSGGGDPSPWTARGVFRGIETSARRRWGSSDLRGRTVAIQGCGNVGRHVALLCAEAGARVVCADVDAARAAHVAVECGGSTVDADRIVAVEADVFAPCALGGVLDDETIAGLRAEIVAGAANNQLALPRHGDLLDERGILYAPDFVVNAGGVLSGSVDLLGWAPSEVPARVDAIATTLDEVYDVAAAERIPPSRAAELAAERRLAR
jgi:leucine dehydrogenase